MRLEATGLRVRLGGREVLRGVDLRIEPGAMVGVVGPNGCGKSTLLRAIAGVRPPDAGAAEFFSPNGARLGRAERARAVGFVPQHAPTPAMITVRDHVAFGRHPHRRWSRQADASGPAHVERAMETCRVAHLAERRVERLSGGERQRVRIATALAQDPGVLLLDEPLAGLDIEHQHALLESLAAMNRREGRTVLMVLHDLDLALRFFDRLVVMHEGLIVRDAPPTRALTPEVFERVFRVRGRVATEPDGGNPVVICVGGLERAAAMRT